MPRKLRPTITAANSPGWLPAGWIMESKALRSGRETRSYVHLQTGRKFSAKDDVIQHIAMEKVREKRLQLAKRHFEICTKNQSTKIAADTEPDNNLECLPDNSIVEVIIREKPCSPAKRQKQEYPETRRQLFADQDTDPFLETEVSTEAQDEGVSSEAGVATFPIVELLTEAHLVNVSVGIAVQTKEISGLSGSTGLLKAEGNKGYQLISVPHPASEILSDKISHESDIENLSARNTEQIPDQSLNANEISQQVHETDPAYDGSHNFMTLRNKNKDPLEDQDLVKKSQPSIMLSFGDPSLVPYKSIAGTVPIENLTANDWLLSTKSRGSKRPKSSTRRNNPQKIKKTNSKLPRKSPEQHAEPAMVPNFLLGEGICGFMERKSSLGHTDICSTSNGFSGKTKKPMDYLRDYLSDMSLEFSFKSIIGEAAKQDESVISNYLKQHCNARSAGEGTHPLPDFGLPSFSHIEISPDEPDEQFTMI